MTGGADVARTSQAYTCDDEDLEGRGGRVSGRLWFGGFVRSLLFLPVGSFFSCSDYYHYYYYYYYFYYYYYYYYYHYYCYYYYYHHHHHHHHHHPHNHNHSYYLSPSSSSISPPFSSCSPAH